MGQKAYHGYDLMCLWWSHACPSVMVSTTLDLRRSHKAYAKPSRPIGSRITSMDRLRQLPGMRIVRIFHDDAQQSLHIPPIARAEYRGTAIGSRKSRDLLGSNY